MLESMLAEHSVVCPYCSHRFDTLIDCSVEEQEYYQDCQGCCAPILFTVRCSYDGTLLQVDCRTDRD